MEMLFDTGSICPLCHKGVLKIQYNEKSFMEEVICDVCLKKFIIECTSDPFKITKVTECNE